MSNVCKNCNIQNSNPSINSGNGSFSSLNIVVPKKRYNPALLLASSSGSLNTSNQGTQQAINPVVDVSPQQNAGSGNSTQNNQTTSGSSTSLSNLQTLVDVLKVEDVTSNIVALDNQTKSKMKVASNLYQQQNDLLLNVDKSISKQSNTSRKQIKTSAQISTIIEAKIKTGNQSRHRTVKTFGTLLSSSPEYQNKLKSLIVVKKDIQQPSLTLPDNFDGRIVWSKYIQEVRNQGLCGSCWAFSTVFVLATRLSIYSMGKYNYILSPSKLVFCNVTSSSSREQAFLDMVSTQNNNLINYYDFSTSDNDHTDSFSCEGETLINAWQYLYRYGTPEENCLLYGDNNETLSKNEINLVIHDTVSETCTKQFGKSFDVCRSSGLPTIYHRSGGYYIVAGIKSKNETLKPSGTEYDIREEIYRWGPVTSAIMIFPDFLQWDGNGIYEWNQQGSVLGGHSIVIIGWGIDASSGKKYWIIRNSWGNDWGKDNGYFKILRGVNMCEIEDNVVVGIPDIPFIKNEIKYPILFDDYDNVFRYLWNVTLSGLKITTIEKDVSYAYQKNIYTLDNFPKTFNNYIAGEISEGFFFLNITKKSHLFINMDTLRIILILILSLILFTI